MGMLTTGAERPVGRRGAARAAVLAAALVLAIASTPTPVARIGAGLAAQAGSRTGDGDAAGRVSALPLAPAAAVAPARVARGRIVHRDR